MVFMPVGHTGKAENRKEKAETLATATARHGGPSSEPVVGAIDRGDYLPPTFCCDLSAPGF
jgi:hypothetical protein